MEKESRRVTITKRLIKEALLDILSRKELDKISITELCQQADVNRATFYRHYAAPTEVLDDIEGDIARSMQDISPLPASTHEAKAYLQNVCHHLFENQETIRVLIKANSDHILFKALYGRHKEIIMTQARSAGRIIDEDSAELLATYLAGGGYCMLRQWMVEETDKSPDEIAELLYLLLTRNVD